MANANDAPSVAAPITDQNATQGAAFSFTVPGGSFADVDTGDALTYTATLASGAALPSWLSFDAATQTFSGTPGSADVGAISVRVTATDTSNATVFDDFALTVANANDAPTVAAPIADQNAMQGAAFSFAVPGGSFADIDAGDTLRYSATLGSGGALPAWLSFDAATQTFSGTPGNADVGAISVRVTATDTSNASVFDDFTLTVANANDAPLITSNGGGSSAAVSLAEGTTAVTQVTATDPDAADVLRFTVSGGIDAARFSIDPVSGALSFVTPPDREQPADADGDNRYEVIVSVSDGTVSAQQQLFIDVAGVDEAPSIVSNTLLLSKGSATLVLLGTDPDTAANSLNFQVSGLVGGRFELVAAPGSAITGFSQAQIAAGAVRFVPDGSGAAPAYVLSLSDGVSSVTSGAPTLVYQDPPVLAPTPPTAPAPSPQPPVVAPEPAPQAATAAVGAAPAAAAPPPVQTSAPGGGDLSDAFGPPLADSGTQAVRSGRDALPSAPPPAPTLAHRDVTAKAVETLIQFSLPSEGLENDSALALLPADLASALRDRLLSKELDLLRDAEQGSRHASAELRASGTLVSAGLSVGYVLWLARGGALVASLMSALPAWAIVDPLPVLAKMKRGDDEPELDEGDADHALEQLFSKPRHAPPVMPQADVSKAGAPQSGNPAPSSNALQVEPRPTSHTSEQTT